MNRFDVKCFMVRAGSVLCLLALSSTLHCTWYGKPKKFFLVWREIASEAPITWHFTSCWLNPANGKSSNVSQRFKIRPWPSKIEAHATSIFHFEFPLICHFKSSPIRNAWHGMCPSDPTIKKNFICHFPLESNERSEVPVRWWRRKKPKTA